MDLCYAVYLGDGDDLGLGRRIEWLGIFSGNTVLLLLLLALKLPLGWAYYEDCLGMLCVPSMGVIVKVY